MCHVLGSLGGHEIPKNRTLCGAAIHEHSKISFGSRKLFVMFLIAPAMKNATFRGKNHGFQTLSSEIAWWPAVRVKYANYCMSGTESTYIFSYFVR